MLSAIGSPRPAEGIVDLLLECHARIRSFSDLAVRLGEAAQPPRAEVADAAARIRRYFVEALPLHARDEEESVLPRLAGRDPAVDAALVAMHREHVEHGAVLDPVIALCADLAAAPERHAELAPALARAARALRAHFEAHLASEEATIFPAVARVVPEDERRRMADELRGRRTGAVPPPGPGARPSHSSR
ncbi:MAG TPA: hemerythrin domain-containing protein [Anaeromyxobacter sp.]|nr:hemerythrin domain-containing protein [Anaeromyxobacter sp.]